MKTTPEREQALDGDSRIAALIKRRDKVLAELSDRMKGNTAPAITRKSLRNPVIG